MRNCAFWRPNPGSREAQVRKWLVVSRADGGVCELVGSRSRTLRVFNLTPPGDSCGVQNGREEGSPRRPHPPPKGAGGGGRNAAAAAGDRRALEPAPPRSEGAGWPGRPSGCPSVWGQGSGTGPRSPPTAGALRLGYWGGKGPTRECGLISYHGAGGASSGGGACEGRGAPRRVWFWRRPRPGGGAGKVKEAGDRPTLVPAARSDPWRLRREAGQGGVGPPQ